MLVLHFRFVFSFKLSIQAENADADDDADDDDDDDDDDSVGKRQGARDGHVVSVRSISRKPMGSSADAPVHADSPRCNTMLHTLQYVAIHCSILQYVAIHCSILQYIAPHCNTLQYTGFTQVNCMYTVPSIEL